MTDFVLSTSILVLYFSPRKHGIGPFCALSFSSNLTKLYYKLQPQMCPVAWCIASFLFVFLATFDCMLDLTYDKIQFQ